MRCFRNGCKASCFWCVAFYLASLLPSNQSQISAENEYSSISKPEMSITAGAARSGAAESLLCPPILNSCFPEYTGDAALAVTVEPPDAEEHTIKINFSIPEVIELSLAETEISFEAGDRPGAYQADDSLHIQVSTNTRRWRIVCEATPFQHATIEDCTIPLDRAQFKVRCDTPCNKRSSGKLAESVTLFQGDEPVSGLDIYVYFKIIVRPTDPAGIYTAQVTLKGEVQQ